MCNHWYTFAAMINTNVTADAKLHAFTERFQLALKKVNLETRSLTDLGVMLGVSRAFVSRMRSGKTKCGSDLGVSIAGLTGVTYEWLMTGQGEMEKEIELGSIVISHLSREKQEIAVRLVKALEN